MSEWQTLKVGWKVALTVGFMLGGGVLIAGFIVAFLIILPAEWLFGYGEIEEYMYQMIGALSLLTSPYMVGVAVNDGHLSYRALRKGSDLPE